MYDRRNHLRRRICGGIVVGAAAGLVLAVLETSWLLAVAAPALAFAAGQGAPTGPWEGVAAGSVLRGAFRFALTLGGVTLALGAVVGALQGAIVAAVDRLTFSLGTRKGRPRRAAALYTLVTTPLVAIVCALAFSGPRARALPGRDLLAVGAGAVLLALVYGVVRIALALRPRLAADPPGDGARGWRPFALACAGILVVVAGGLLVADHVLLVRLYAFFHVGLELGAFVALEMAVLAAAIGARAGERRWAALAAPRAALILALVAATAGALALGRLRSAPAAGLRAMVHEQGSVAGRLMDGVRLLGLSIAAPAPPVAERRAPAGDEAVIPRAVLEADAPRRAGADVLLITVDALRADHLGAYGYARPTSPRIDALAAQSVVFERAYTVAPHTSFSLASLLTSKYVFSLAQLGLADGHETLPQVFRRYGYKTAGFYTPAIFTIDRVKFASYEEKGWGFDYLKVEPFPEDVAAPRRTEQVLAFLGAEDPGRTFMWVHYFGPHEPYLHHPELGPPLPFGERQVDRYDEEIRWVDGEIGRLVDAVRARRPDTIIVLTADHGEEFGEHGGAYHGSTLYDEQVRVPLIVSVPGLPPRRVRAPVSNIHVAPTILSLVDLPPSVRMRGTDLSAWFAPSRPPPEALLPPTFSEVGTQRMVARGSDKLVCDLARAFCRLYALDEDPRELADYTARRPARAAALRAELDAWLAHHGELERGGGGATRARRAALERAEMGDRSVLPLVVDVVADPQAAVEDRRAAARAFVRLWSAGRLAADRALPGQAAGATAPSLTPPEGADAALAAARRAGDPKLAAWAAVALAILGDAAVAGELEGQLLATPPAPHLAADGELFGRAAIAVADANRPRAREVLVAALERARDVRVRAEIVAALGRTGDHEATPLLFKAYEKVLTRRHAADALARLGDPRAVPFLIERLGDEPYVSVRAVVARSLGRMGDRRARGPLRALFARDPEPIVAGAAAVALAALGDATPVRAGRAVVRAARPADTLWLVVRPGEAGPIRVLAGGDTLVVDTAIPKEAYAVTLPRRTRTLRARIEGPVSHALLR